MKRNSWAVLIALTFMSIDGNAQFVSFSGTHISLEDFFSAVTKQTGFVFFYSTSILKNASPVSIHVENISLDSAMQVALKNQPFAFAIRGKTIFITAVQTDQPFAVSKNPDLLWVTGLVTDSSGDPIASATVFSEETKTSVITRENGKFQIRVRPGDLLTVSSMGYKKIRVTANSPYVKIFMQVESNPLEQVVVGGNFFAMKKKSEISSITVIDSSTLQTLPVTDISEIYRGLVPGTNSYSAGDITQWFPTLTIRGAGSEISISQISVYVDGIEWAGGSGYLAVLNKENIERIEILRGPVSSTLYGTGSNGGIVQIFTKKGNPQSNGLFASAAAGFIQSKWVASSVFQQYYSLEKTLGFQRLGISLGGTWQTNGAYLPGGGGKTGTAHIGLKWDPGKKLSVNLVGYFAGTINGESRSPLYDTCTHLSDTVPNYGVYPRKLTNKEDYDNSYFTGINLSYRANANWNHLLTLGYSQNDYHETPVSVIDSNGLKPANFFKSQYKSTTIRYSNILNLSNTKSDWTVSILSGVDYKNDYIHSLVQSNPVYYRDNYPANANTGVFVQLNPSYKNIYLTAGLRYDYNTLFANNHSLNPRLGLTTNFSVAELIVKPRISWGSGITAPSYTARYGDPTDGYSIVLANPDIKPQEQSGFDYGVEFYDRKNRFSGEVVYYDNLLKNMFAENELPDASNGMGVFQYTNVGLVANRGWEFSGKYKLNRRLSMYGSFSIMHSVVKDSTGDYLSAQLAGHAPGYQLRNLPLHTAGLFLNYNFFKLFRKKDRGNINLNITEVDGVYNYDVVRLSIDEAYKRVVDTGATIPNGYLVSNGTIFRLGLNVEYYVTEQLRFYLQGSNILNQNNTEQATEFPSHGGSWLFGFKWALNK